MPRVTALRPGPGERVRVELDGAAWRTLPAAAVVAAGLRAGLELDRTRARELRRALRRYEALAGAAKALARRERSAAELDALLARRGIAAAQRAGALETMTRLGYLDDARFATRAGAGLATRGYGDEAIRVELARQGVGAELIEQVLVGLEPEAVRAGRQAAGKAADKALRALVARGFSYESIESALGVVDG